MIMPDGRDVLVLEIQTPEGPLRATLVVPLEPLRLPELAWSFLGISNKLTDLGVAREAREGRIVSCQKGCGACCRQLVPLSPPEAWMIADVVAGLSPARGAEVRRLFGEAVETIGRSGVRAALERRMERVEQMTSAALDYFRLGVACPFLRDDACSIHPYRPSICREYLVTSPASHCAELGRRPIERVPVNVRLSEALANLTAKLLGKEAEVVPMTLSLEWAEAHREDGRRTWPARELIEGLVADLGSSSPERERGGTSTKE